jgi:hypothetical protein
MAPRLSFCVGALLLLGFQSSFAAEHLLDIDNRVGKFQTFYASATAETLNPDLRFKLWEKVDGLAAVPPGPEGDTMARQLLDSAWTRYPALMPKLPALETNAESIARKMFLRDNEILGTAMDPIHTRLILYVGQFDNNAFTIPPMDGKAATVLMPVENINLKIALEHFPISTHRIPLRQDSFDIRVG